LCPRTRFNADQNGLYAFVVGNENKVEMRNVKVGQEGSGQSVILQGLSPGEKVVIAGQYRLQQGALVQPTDAITPSAPEKATPSAAAKTP
jgi:membrane fusion protein, multidrug efflux system